MKAMKHQTASLKFLKTRKVAADFSDPGCVSADTEFLTPTGWKRIDQYTDELVAQFHPETREIEFVKPIEYVKRPCKTMIAIAPARGTSQRLSHEHRVLYYKRDGSHGVKSAAEFMVDLHENGAYRADAKFCTTYSVRSTNQLDLNDYQIRLMVAVIADGYFQTNSTNRCVVRLKKPRKIERLSELLMAARIQFEIRNCGGKDPDFKVFKFDAPRHEKEFTEYWWGASQKQLEVIADEICYWDSSQDKRDSNGTRFSTLIEASADFAQYAFSAAKRPTSLTFAVRDRREQDRGIGIEFNVHAQDDDKFIGPGRADSVYEVANPEGFKYCFEVPTSFLLLRHNGYIFATGNTGKTYVEIMDFLQQWKKDGKALLVLCPKSLMRAAWANDIHKFAPQLKVSLCYATKRQESLDASADVYIVNVDGVKDLVKLKPLFWKKFGRVVIDESDAYKHPTSKRSKAAAKVVKNFEWRRILSGTPTSNGICDLFHQIFILDGGKRLGTSFFGFRSACCTPEQVGSNANMLRWTDKEGIELQIGALISDIVIRHKFEDCVDIPQNHIYAVPTQLTAKHRKVYDALESNAFAILEDASVTAVNKAVLMGKLLQCVSGAVYNDDGGYSLIESERYEIAIDLVEARAHSVVFYTWEHQLVEMIKLAKARKISHTTWDSNHPEIETDFQAGKYQVLFAHPASAGHGLTLTKGTATIWPSPTYNLTHFRQGLKRIHRIGQKEKTETIVIVAEDTRDELAWEALNYKGKNMDALLKEFE